MRLKTLVYRRTFGHLSTENGAVSSIAVQTLVYRGTVFRLSPYRVLVYRRTCRLEKSLRDNDLRPLIHSVTRARDLTRLLFNVLTPPKGVPPLLEPTRPASPSSHPPRGFAPRPAASPQIVRALGASTLKARLRRAGAPPPCNHGLSGSGRPQAAVLTCPASGAPYGR